MTEPLVHIHSYYYGDRPLATFTASKSLVLEKYTSCFYTEAIVDSDHLAEKRIE